MLYKLFFNVLFSFCLLIASYTVAENVDLDEFKDQVEDIIQNFHNNISALPQAQTEEEKALDSAIANFSDVTSFFKSALDNESMGSVISSVDFLTSNIDSAIRTIPSEMVTSMENVDFSSFDEKDMNKLQLILTDMNRNKMNQFRDMVTTMMIMEKNGFAAQEFMAGMQELGMGLALLNDESVEIDFDLASLSNKGLDEVTRELNQLEEDLKRIDVDKISEGISQSVEDVSVISVTEQVVDNASLVAEVTQTVSEVTEAVVENIAETIQETVISSRFCSTKSSGESVCHDNPTDEQRYNPWGHEEFYGGKNCFKSKNDEDYSGCD